MSLTGRPDGFEYRFLRRWVAAWIIMLLIDVVIVELFARLRADAPAEVDLADEIVGLSSLEGLIYLIAFILKPIIAWIALSGAYPRPSLAAWISWMALGLVLLLGFFALTMAAFAPPEGSTPDIGIAAYILAYVVDLCSKLGYVLAFFVVSWRVGASVLTAFSIATLMLAIFGASSLFSEVIWALETYAENDVRGGLEWFEFLAWSLENIILGTMSGLAIIYGNRWQVRDVDDRVFD